MAAPKNIHIELENQWVRAFREHMDPHGILPMHSHPAPGAVIVLLTARDNRLTPEHGAPQEMRNGAGEVMWAAPSVHKGENLLDKPFEAVQIEPRQPAGTSAAHFVVDKTDATVVDPQHYHVELENQYVRVLRVEIGPHEKLKMHTHPQTGAVLVQLTDQNLRLTSADGTSRASKYSAGQVRWVDPPATAHQDENLSDQPLEFIRVELKYAAGDARR